MMWPGDVVGALINWTVAFSLPVHCYMSKGKWKGQWGFFFKSSVRLSCAVSFSPGVLGFLGSAKMFLHTFQ